MNELWFLNFWRRDAKKVSHLLSEKIETEKPQAFFEGGHRQMNPDCCEGDEGQAARVLEAERPRKKKAEAECC